EATLEWNDAAVEGAHRFLRRVWALGAKLHEWADDHRNDVSDDARSVRREVHQILQQVSFDYGRMQYNTVVSGAMKLLNALESAAPRCAGMPAVLREGYGILLRVLYPATPHIAHALWQELGYATKLGDLLDAPWPQVDEAALIQDEVELVLQVNGKLRGALKVPATADKAAIEAAALASPEFAKHAEGRPAKKVVVVPGRLVNVVV
ncbi:MAG: class I tRNA ligase family protein, partial [Thiomonas delicata]